jgi:polyisoprenoid-binding protein YceI
MIRLLALAAVPAALLCLAPAPKSAAAPTPIGVPAAGLSYQIDGTHSAVVFKIKHAGASWFYGTFEAVSGTLSVDEADPSKSAIQVEIDAGSVDTNNADRDGHIESPDFLSAVEFPSITFQSTAVKSKGKDQLEVTGDLTFRGVKKSITVPVAYVGKGEFHGKRIGYETTFSFKRSEFGSTYGLDEGALGDEVFLTVALEGVAP